MSKKLLTLSMHKIMLTLMDWQQLDRVHIAHKHVRSICLSSFVLFTLVRLGSDSVRCGVMWCESVRAQVCSQLKVSEFVPLPFFHNKIISFLGWGNVPSPQQIHWGQRPHKIIVLYLYSLYLMKSKLVLFPFLHYFQNQFEGATNNIKDFCCGGNSCLPNSSKGSETPQSNCTLFVLIVPYEV